MGTKQIKDKDDNQQQFQYKNLEGCQILQEEKCFALAFNQNCSYLVAGSDFNIKVFKFDDEQLQPTQLLIAHKDYVQTLNFMKQTNQRFISGSRDSFIIIWELNNVNSWYSKKDKNIDIIFQKDLCKFYIWVTILNRYKIQQYKTQTLNYHNLSITCLIISKDEDFIFSGSDDRTIKLYNKNYEQEWFCKQSIIDHSGTINGLSLNQDQNKLISCAQDLKILIIERDNDNWIVIQSIAQYGLRLCFIFDNFFTFQPNDNIMYIYYPESNQQIVNYKKKNQYETRRLCLCSLFPQQFIKSKSLLMNKNGGYVHFIKILDLNTYYIVQTINFGTYCLSGEISEDGEYFVTWDNLSNQIQVKKYIEC